jgi:hypothetical protein
MNNFATKDDLAELDSRLKKIEGLLKNIRNAPVISGYTGKRLVLNENLNVLSIKKDISEIAARVTALE